MRLVHRRTRTHVPRLLAVLLACTLVPPAFAARQDFVFISDTTETSSNATDALLQQAEATRAYRLAQGGLDAVPLFISSDVTAAGHGWQRSFMQGRPFALYERNFYPGLGNYQRSDSVGNCFNNTCAREVYQGILGWAAGLERLRDFDHSYAAGNVHSGSLAYSLQVDDVAVIRLQDDPGRATRFSSLDGLQLFTADIGPSLDFLRRQLQWASASGKNVILSMHTAPQAGSAFARLVAEYRDRVLAIVASQPLTASGLLGKLEGIPVYSSGSADDATWLTARYDSDTHTLDVHAVRNNDWASQNLVGSSTAVSSNLRSNSVPLPEVPDPTGWGTWGDVAMCPDGQYISAMKVRGAPFEGNGPIYDDTALNAVTFRCTGDTGSTWIHSKEAPWGSWGRGMFCPNRVLANGFQMRIEEDQGSGDDTGLNNVALLCSDGSRIVGDPPAEWGDWHEEHRCPAGMVLAGFVTKVEDPVGIGDDTALNRIQMFCRMP